MISLNAKRLSRDFFGPEGSGRGACPAASKERQKSSISQKMVTISMQNSSGMGLAAQGRFYLSHSARVLLFYFVELTLPYTLRWEALTIEAQRPGRLTIQAFGDFEGRGIWTLEQQGDVVKMIFDWNLTAE